MRANPLLSKVLEKYKKGEILLEDAAREIEGLRIERVGDFACLDLGRPVRCGMPEVGTCGGQRSLPPCGNSPAPGRGCRTLCGYTGNTESGCFR